MRRPQRSKLLLVSIHASAGEATHGSSGSFRCVIGFNPRLRRGGDWHPKPPLNPALCCFNPRLRRGGDSKAALLNAATRCGFQSTPPQGRRPGDSAGDQDAQSKFQSTPPQGRRRSIRFRRAAAGETVSIHASAGEATRPSTQNRPHRQGVSIHASAGEATAFCGAPGLGLGVSIHASAGEATIRRNQDSRTRTNGFNPRLRRGGDSTDGVRSSSSRRFNPRLRRGGDPHRLMGFGAAAAVSIHASAGEATTSWS